MSLVTKNHLKKHNHDQYRKGKTVISLLNHKFMALHARMDTAYQTSRLLRRSHVS